MTWGLTLMIVPANVRSFADLPSGYMPPVIGPKQEVIATLVEALPGLDFSYGWGDYGGTEFGVNVDLCSTNDSDDVDVIGISAVGNEAAVPAVLRFSEVLECAAFDNGTGERLDCDPDPGKGFRLWRGYRDHVVGEAKDN